MGRQKVVTFGNGYKSNDTVWLLSMLETRNIEIYYGKIMVVRGLSLKVEEGQIRAILGANGAGKSTTLKTIM